MRKDEGLAALELAAADADRLAAPQRVDEPLVAAGTVFELGRNSGGQALHRRAFLRLGGLAPSLEEELFVEDFAFVLRGGGEQGVGHDGECSGVACGMDDGGVLERCPHQRRIAPPIEQVGELFGLARPHDAGLDIGRAGSDQDNRETPARDGRDKENILKKRLPGEPGEHAEMEDRCADPTGRQREPYPHRSYWLMLNPVAETTTCTRPARLVV